jgi:hypothetical protein
VSSVGEEELGGSVVGVGVLSVLIGGSGRDAAGLIKVSDPEVNFVGGC